MPKVTGQAVVEPGAGPGSLAPVPGCAPNMQLVPVRPAHPHSSGDFGHESAGNSELSVCLSGCLCLSLPRPWNPEGQAFFTSQDKWPDPALVAQALILAVSPGSCLAACPSGGALIDSSSGWSERTGAVDPAATPLWPVWRSHCPLWWDPAWKVLRQDSEPSILTRKPKGKVWPAFPSTPSIPQVAGSCPQLRPPAAAAAVLQPLVDSFAGRR